MGKTISLRGKAAKAFLETKVKPTTPASDLEKYERVATLVYMYIKVNDMPGAVRLLTLLHDSGLNNAHNFIMVHSAELDKKPCRSGSRKSKP
jgi:signal recognition particle receptor subunit beta